MTGSEKTPSDAPDWLLERAAIGEAPDSFEPDEMAMAQLRASTDNILAELPPAVVAEEVERRARLAPNRRRRALFSFRPFSIRSWVAGPILVAVAALALVVISNRDDRSTASNIDEAELDSGIRIKGDIRLLLHRKLGDDVLRLEDGASVQSGDRLQLSYIAAGREHGVIVSVDGAGQVTLHHPASKEGSTVLKRNKATPLEHSYRLDNAPRFERFFFVASNKRIEPSAVVSAAEALFRDGHAQQDPLFLSPGLTQTSFIVHKSVTP